MGGGVWHGYGGVDGRNEACGFGNVEWAAGLFWESDEGNGVILGVGPWKEVRSGVPRPFRTVPSVLSFNQSSRFRKKGKRCQVGLG